MAKGRVLVIAGSDSSGGAGVEADQKVLAAHGCYALNCITALTAQNTCGVNDIHHIPPEFVRKSIDTCLTDIDVDVIKTGMLSSADTIKVIGESIVKYHLKTIVVDPVMVSTSGSQLLPKEAVREIREHLIPYTTILTPNVPEALLLLSDAGKSPQSPKNIEDLIELAKAVHSLGPKYVLVKGGHLPFKGDGDVAQSIEEREFMIDILYGNGKVTEIKTAYQNSKNTHGTGCSLASAIASNLANGHDIIDAVKRSCRYVEVGIKTSIDMGHGNGPINHFHSTYTLPFSPGYFIDYLLERPDVQKPWKEHTEHKFVAGLGDGTLPVQNFKYYLIQDYLFLVQFARANSLAGYKAKSTEDSAAAAKIVTHIHHEMELHIEYCKGFGVTKKEMESTAESQACTAYTRWVLDIGLSQDWFALQIALAPCLIGYGVIAKRLYADPRTKVEGNIYWKWITNYMAEDYSEAVKVGSELLERNAILESPSRIENLVKIFIHGTKMETGFWDMGVGAS